MGLVVGLPLLCQAWIAMESQGQAGQKGSKPAVPHLPQIHGHNNGTHLTTTHKEVELTLDESVIVRRKFPPDQYDDKGKLRKPTAAELSEAKGPDKTLPHYKADIFDLKNGQVVEVQLYKKKDDSKSGDKNKEADNKAADNKAADKPDTAGWVKAGVLAGTVSGYGGKSTSTLTLRVDSTALAGRNHHTTNNGKNNKITL